MQEKLWNQIKTLTGKITDLERKERRRYYEERRERAEKEWREHIEEEVREK